MRFFGEFLNTFFTMYRLMLYFLGTLVVVAIVLSALGFLPYRPLDIALQTIAFVALCWAANTFLARLVKTKPNFESPIITALILSLIAGPFSLPEEWLPLVVMAGAAMASKYLLVRSKSHVFNPAAFGVVVSALVLQYPASWWVGSKFMLPFVLVGGLLMVRRIRRFPLVLSFLGLYLGFLSLEPLLAAGSSLLQVATLVQNLLFSSPLLFFAFVMLVEPLTAPQTPLARTQFGVLVGGTFFLLQRFASAIPFSLEFALLLGNAFFALTSPGFRQSFVLRKKENLAPSISNFWLEPVRPFSFRAGQFLEYTLAHAHSDARGMRRYFTIASSPKETQILLCSRFSEKGSSFKKALAAMQEGQEIIASKVAGDFVLPPDKTKKIAFIAGGIGVTPFRSMVKYLLDTNQSRNIVLLYGAEKEGDLVFRDVFQKAQTKFGMKSVYVTEGFIDEKVIVREVPDFKERIFYVSGPEPMVQALGKTLGNMGVPRKQIKRDYFPGYKAV